MDYYLLVGTVTLLSQVAVFVLLLGGYTLKKMGRFRVHGVFMLVGVVLHLAVIGFIMVPSYVLSLIPVAARPVDIVSVLASVHGVAGTTAAVLGVWIVGSWRLRRSWEYCVPKKKWMLITFTVWSASLVLGFLLYLSLFWALLFG
jgi:hypothetical protein